MTSSQQPRLSQIHIQDLHLRAIIGIFDWERKNLQDVFINITLEFDSTQAAKTDDINHTIDYKTLTKNIIQLVESSQFQLIEALADRILAIALKPELVQSATVRVDKPGALRFTKTVGITVYGQK